MIFKSVLGIANKLLGLVSKLTDYLKERSLRKQGRKEQKLEDLEGINELHEEAEEIDAKPDLDKQQQLDWMRGNRQDG